MIRIAIQETDFDIGAELAALGRGEAIGAVASFIGQVRDDGGLAALVLEQYPGMTEAACRGVAEEAAARWPLLGVTVIHRHGRLVPGDRIVLAAAASAHRGAALEAVMFLMDWLKTKAPFWKRELLLDGASRWVEPRLSDAEAAARWG